MQFAGELFKPEKRPCNLREGFSASKTAPAICKATFRRQKGFLQSAWVFSDSKSAADTLHGCNLSPRGV